MLGRRSRAGRSAGSASRNCTIRVYSEPEDEVVALAVLHWDEAMSQVCFHAICLLRSSSNRDRTERESYLGRADAYAFRSSLSLRPSLVDSVPIIGVRCQECSIARVRRTRSPRRWQELRRV